MKKIKSIKEYFAPKESFKREYFYKTKIDDEYIKLMGALSIPERKFEEVYSVFMDEITNKNVVQFSFDDWLDNEDNYIDYLN